MLMKPTLALPHGGGLKLEVNSSEFPCWPTGLRMEPPCLRCGLVTRRLSASTSFRRAPGWSRWINCK